MMNLARIGLVSCSVALLLSLSAAPSRAQSRALSLVGTLAPWPAGQYSNVAADATRRVAYMGSWDGQGVAVIDTRDPAHPVLTEHFSTHIVSDTLISDSADLDLVGRYLAVSHQSLSFGVPGAFQAGLHRIAWTGHQADGRPLGRGIYFARLTSTAGTASAKLAHLGN